MARKGDYSLARQDPDDLRGAKDSSFAACIASLLVFFALCVIIILATYPWSNKWSDKKNTHTKGGTSDGQHAGNFPKKSTTPSTDENFEEYSGGDEIDVRIGETTKEPTIQGRNEEVDDNDQSTTTKKGRSGKALFTGTEAAPGNEPLAESTLLMKLMNSTSTAKTTDASTTTPAGITEADQQQVAASTCAPELETEDEVCSSQQCSAYVGRMLSLMDVSADPCTDFYSFACGGLRSRDVSVNNPTLRMEERVRNALDLVSNAKTTSLRKRFFKKFYEDCLEYEHNFDEAQRIEKAKDFIKTVGEFSKINSTADGITNLLVTLFKFNSAPLFEIMLDVSDDGGDAPFTLKIVPPLSQHSLLDASVDINAAKCFMETKPADDADIDLEQNYENYKICKGSETDFTVSVKEVLLKIGAFDEDSATLKAIITLEALLRTKILDTCQISDQDVKINMLTKQYTKYTVGELQATFTMVNWETLFKEVLNVNSSQITAQTVVQLYTLQYFRELFDTIDIEAENTAIADALLAIFSHSLYSDLVKPSGTCDRPKMCLNLARSLIDDVASEMYLSTFSENRVNSLNLELEKMFKKESDILSQRILTSDWTNEEAKKERLAEKLNEMSLKFGGTKTAVPKALLKEDDLNEDFFNKIITLLQRRRLRMYADFKKGSKPSGHDQIWSHFSLPIKTYPNAVYGLNSIAVPLGAMTSPYHIPSVPKYVNMGKIGSIMAHEIIHHFDATGINYDSTGKRVDRDKSDFSYEKIFQHVSDSFSQTFSSEDSFTLPNGKTVKYKLNPELTKNERFADVGALDLAYETYLEWRKSEGNASHLNLPYLKYDWQKVFFISHAQMMCERKDFLEYRVALFEEEHLPSIIRVNKIPTNSLYFREAFTCKAPNRKQ